jgi:1-deoxy-D-xylulose-5-phosphate reductoisomerase
VAVAVRLAGRSVRDTERVIRDVVLLGSTGSVGEQTVDVVSARPERFRIVGLAAGGSRPAALAGQLRRTGARLLAVPDEAAADAVLGAAGPAASGVEVLTGPEAVAELAGRPCDVVVNALSGAAGLPPTLAALAAGRRLALANKESLIVGGPLVADRVEQIVPVDSEHSALAQCLRGGRRSEVRRLVLTASGGPFRGRRRAELAAVTPEQALAHPTWSMGPLVTVNSATLVNKGLEVIEAHLLFGVPLDRIDVVVHPQSIVHSMVEFADGATLAQASPPDMRLPIAVALGWPDRVPGAAAGLDWSQAQCWEFRPLDEETFPAVRLARRVAAARGVLPAVYNAANEECVAAFLAGRLPFLGIVDTVAAVVAAAEAGELAVSGAPAAAGSLTLADVLAADAWARARAATAVAAAGGAAAATAPAAETPTSGSGASVRSVRS